MNRATTQLLEANWLQRLPIRLNPGVSAKCEHGLKHESGVGLVEVMVAMAIILITAFATSSLQTSSLTSAQVSSLHFSIDHLSSEILGVLRLHAEEAQSGLFDLDPDAEEDETAVTHPEIVLWKERISESIPTGEGSISCAVGVCSISISWMEEIDGSIHRQFFRSSTPL